MEEVKLLLPDIVKSLTGELDFEAGEEDDPEEFTPTTDQDKTPPAAEGKRRKRGRSASSGAVGGSSKRARVRFQNQGDESGPAGNRVSNFFSSKSGVRV